MALQIPGMPRPHHITVTLYRDDESTVEASLGAITRQDQLITHNAKIEVRVGSRSFDNGNFTGGAGDSVVVVPVPIDDDTNALRHILWLAIDGAYKSAASTFEAKRAHRETKATGGDRPEDFSSAPVQQYSGQPASPLPPIDAMAELAASGSAVFTTNPHVHRSVVRVVAHSSSRTLLDSDGTTIEDSKTCYRAEVVAYAQAPDGMVIADSEHRWLPYQPLGLGESTSELLQIKSAAERIARQLDELTQAPMVESYSGPVAFVGEASPQLFRYLLADELSATPLPEPRYDMGASSRSLSTLVNRRILPAGFDVVDDPAPGNPGLIGAMSRYVGEYRFDDEGVPSQEVRVVQDGMLKTLLSSRTPSLQVPVSNGHGRAGLRSVARGRVSRLTVSTRNGLSETRLVDKAVELARTEGLDHVFVITRLGDPAMTRGILPHDARSTAGQTALVAQHVSKVTFGPTAGKAGIRYERVRGATLRGMRTQDLRQIAAACRTPHAYSYLASDHPQRAQFGIDGAIPATVLAPSVLLPYVDITPLDPPFPQLPIAPR
ncbi:MAG: metallopeptidase TldD-related protein [Polyangiaceae bacterium]|nr:metallopeptidase TldD-related protein [Polyangiaceae bacterium]